MNILQYESKIWATANLLRGCGIKESEWPSCMMPFFALTMVESRLARMFDHLKADLGEDAFKAIDKDDLYAMIRDEGQGYNPFIFEKNQSLTDICKNDKSFDIDFEAYLNGFDGETKDLLGVDAKKGEEFLDISGVIAKLKAKNILLGYTQLWAEIDLKPFNNSEITTLEEHIKRKWADISADTAGEQYTPDDVIALIAEIIASKIEDSNTLLKIYDCTCGGGNMLFGVEDRINQKYKRLTQTFGQDWNDALYALAKIESRFRTDSKIEYGNTLVSDKFYNDEFDVVIANPPYGVSWKGYAKDIRHDKTERFNFIPSISDGQLLFMQHLISKLDSEGMGVVVHNGSTLFSGDAGSAESNIRKWMLDKDIVEAVIQLPTDEFFNTGIYTYLWVLNKNKQPQHKDKVMLINASEKFTPLKKSKGSKRKQVDEKSRLDIVATLTAYQDNDYARVFDKEFFYFNKQAIQLTNIDEDGFFLKEKIRVDNEQLLIDNDLFTLKVNGHQLLLKEASAPMDNEQMAMDNEQLKVDNGFERLEPTAETASRLKELFKGLNYKEHHLKIHTPETTYGYDQEKESLVQWIIDNEQLITKDDELPINNYPLSTINYLGCGRLVVKSSLKKATKKLPERIEVSVDLAPDYQKDYEIIPFHKDEPENQQAIEAFMAKYISKPFIYLDNVVGVELNFNKVFYKPEKLRTVTEILADIEMIDKQLSELEAGLVL